MLGTGKGVGCVVQCAQLGWVNLDRQDYGERAHREGSEREPPRDSRCSGGVARMRVILVNLPAILCTLGR